MVLVRAGRSGEDQRSDAAVWRLVLVVGAVVFLDTMFYAVIAPLLPQLSHELRMTKLSAGVMTAAYPAGMLIASIPGGILAARAGARFTVCLGLALLACSTIAFAFLRTAAGLDLARLVEGVGGACSWAGGIAWIVAAAPADRRGAMIGRALGAAIGGALFGPAVGALAGEIGREYVFVAVAVLAGVLIAVTRTFPELAGTSDQGVAAILRVMRKPSFRGAMWLMALPAIISGMLSVLGALRLHRFGAGAAVIGAVFLIAAGIEALIAPMVGSLSDRRGRMLPMRAGLVAATVLLLSFTLPSSVAVLGAVVVATATVLGLFWAPAMALLSDAAEAEGLNQALAAALMNLAWAGGQIIGAGGGGAAAKAFGDGVPMTVVAGLCASTLVVLAGSSARTRARARAAAPA